MSAERTVTINFTTDTSGLEKGATKVQGQLSNVAGSAEKAGDGMRKMGDSAEKARSSLDKSADVAKKLRGALTLVNPALGEAAGAIDDMADASEGAKIAAEAMGLSLGSVATVAGAVALAIASIGTAALVMTNELERSSGINAHFEDRLDASEARLASLRGELGKSAASFTSIEQATDDANTTLDILAGRISPEAAAAQKQLSAANKAAAPVIQNLNQSILEQGMQLQLLADAYRNGEISQSEFEAKQAELVTGMNTATASLSEYEAKLKASQDAIRKAAEESERIRKAKEREAEAQKYLDMQIQRSIDSRLAEIEAQERAGEAQIERIQKEGEARHEAEVKAAEERAQREADEQERVDELAKQREEQKKQAEKDAEEAAKLAQEQADAQMAAATQAADTAISAANMVLENKIENAKAGSAEEARLMRFQQTLAVAEITMSTAQGVAQILATYAANPVLAGVLTAATIASGAAQIAVVEQQQAPSYHIGGVPSASVLGAQEGNATVLAGEMVVDRSTTAAVGGPAGLRAMMNGGGGTVIRIGRREVREMVRTDTRSGGMIAQIGRKAAASSTPAGRSPRGTLA